MPSLLERVRAIAFDLDGTLVDTAPDLALAANTMLESLGYPPLAKRLPERLGGVHVDVDPDQVEERARTDRPARPEAHCPVHVLGGDP